MKKLLLSVLLLASSLAHATPGDSACTAKVDGREIEIYIVRNSADDIFSSIEINVDGKNVTTFSKDEARFGMVNVGDSETVFLNDVYSGENMDGRFLLRFPEQDFSGEITAYGDIEIQKAGLDLMKIEMSCQM